MIESSILIRALGRGYAVLLAVVVLLPTIMAQPSGTGTISGTVINANSGNYLNRARVVLKGSTLEALTDENGGFRLVPVPAGAAEVTVTYTGLESQTRMVTVTPGQIARIDVGLALEGAPRDASGIVKLAVFTVEERELSAQGAALNEQRSAPNIKNVVSMEEFGDLGITNPGHFLTYVPGVSNVYNTTGEVEGIGLRGMASSGTLVMFDGAQAASNDPASRSYNFSGTSTANLDRIEVTKVPTPDMPANAVGGSINMVSKSGFNRATPLFRYNVFATLQAKGSNGNLNDGWSKFAGTDDETTRHPIQPGFDLSYSLPLNQAVAFTFNLGHNARYQDREYISPTWDRVRLVQTAGTLNSVLNIFTKDIAAVGADWKTGRNAFRARVDVSLQDAFTRQNVFSYNFGTGATGGATSTEGTAAGVGSLGLTGGQNLNQYRRLLNGRLSHTYSGDIWKFDWNASYSEARRLFSDVDDGLFGTMAATLSNVVVVGQGLDGISSMTMPTLAVKSRTGAVIDPYDTRQYTLNTASSGRMYFKNTVGVAAVNAGRTFATALPVAIKAGAAVEKTERDNWTESMSWNFRPPAAAGGQLVGGYDLLADAYSARRSFNGGLKVNWLSTTKLYELYQQHGDWFQFNDAAAYTNRVNNSKKLDETITAGYVRADLKALENRLWLVGGVRFEHTADEGLGPLNDIRNTFVRDSAGRVVLGANGRPTQLTTDPLALAKLQFQERAAFSEKTYQGYYPSLNASYTVADNFVLRAAYAGTIGRPDLSFITPGTSISDPSVAPRTITVVNTGLQPWTADNYDLTLESYEFKGATVAVSGFRKEIKKFFTAVRVPATQALLDQYGLPADLLTGDYEIITRENSVDDAAIDGFEWSWRQAFRPLPVPTWARSLGLFINGTHLRLGGPGKENFAGYSTRIINWGVAYARAHFAVKVNVTSSNGPRNAVVAANATTPAGTYSSLAPRTLVGGSIEYRLTKHLTVHASGQNLSNTLYRNMTYSPGAPGYVQPTQYRDNGIEYVVGVRGEF